MNMEMDSRSRSRKLVDTTHLRPAKKGALLRHHGRRASLFEDSVLIYSIGVMTMLYVGVVPMNTAILM